MSKSSSNVIKGKCPKCNKTIDLTDIDKNEIIFCLSSNCAYYSMAEEFIAVYRKEREYKKLESDVEDYIKKYESGSTFNNTLTFKDPEYCAGIRWDKPTDRYMHYVKDYSGNSGGPKITVTEFKGTGRRLATKAIFCENSSIKARPTVPITFPCFINKVVDFLIAENEEGRYYPYLHPSFLIINGSGEGNMLNGNYSIDFSPLPVVADGDKYLNEKRQIAAFKRFLDNIEFVTGIKEVKIARSFIKRICRKKFTSMEKLESYVKKDLEVIFTEEKENSKSREFEGDIEIGGKNISFEGKYFCRQGIKERNEDYIGHGFFQFNDGKINKITDNKILPGYDLLSVFVVADGVSRSPHGDWASKLIVEYFLDNAELFLKMIINKDGSPKSDYFIEQAMAGHLCGDPYWRDNDLSCNSYLRSKFYEWEEELTADRIRLELSEDKPPMSTLVLVYIIGKTLYYINVGDSRLYHITQSGDVTVSEDITDARGKLRDPLGRAKCRHNFGKIQLNVNDRILIATDGVYSPVFKKDKMERNISTQSVNKVTEDITKIVTNDSYDNMSAFILKVGEGT